MPLLLRAAVGMLQLALPRVRVSGIQTWPGPTCCPLWPEESLPKPRGLGSLPQDTVSPPTLSDTQRETYVGATVRGGHIPAHAIRVRTFPELRGRTAALLGCSCVCHGRVGLQEGAWPCLQMPGQPVQVSAHLLGQGPVYAGQAGPQLPGHRRSGPLTWVAVQRPGPVLKVCGKETRPGAVPPLCSWPPGRSGACSPHCHCGLDGALALSSCSSGVCVCV